MSFRTAGYTGAAWTPEQIAVSSFADEAWTATGQGRRTSLWTVPNGTGTHVERLRIANSGNVMIGTTTDSGFTLQVNGSQSLGGRLTFGQRVAPGGVAADLSQHIALFDLSGTRQLRLFGYLRSA